MPRQPRQFEVGGIYHVLNRGYEKRQIFFDDRDYERFVKSLFFFNDTKTVEIRTAQIGGLTPDPSRVSLVEILAFALMPNHYHLILREIIEGGISAFMKKLNGGYTVYLNTKYERLGMGGVFQSRYKVVAVRDDAQLLTLFVYVHTNPVELVEPLWKDELKVKDPQKAIQWLEKYRWSSYPDYIREDNFPTVTSREFFLDFLDGEQNCQKAVEDWVLFKAENSQLEPAIVLE